MKYTSIKGMSDILPKDIDLWRLVEESARRVFSLFGYSEIRTPVLEKTELFVRGIGKETSVVSKEMYSFTDAGSENLSLRPEGTASVIRAHIESGAYQNEAVSKYVYIGPMFRRERPQKGRYRQFHQIGVEAIGVGAPSIDAEQISMLDLFFKELQLADYQIEINSLGCKECRPAYNKTFADFLKEKQVHLCADCQRRIVTNPLRAFDCKNPVCIEAMKDAPLIGAFLCKDCNEHFISVQEFLNLFGTKFIVNHRIVRGLDYYMRTAFEFTTTRLGAQNAIAAGGRYDGLVHALGGPNQPGVGFAIGFERVLLMLEELGLVKKTVPEVVFFAMLGSEARRATLPIVGLLRRDGVRAEYDYEDHSLKSQMRQADKLGAHSVVIVGEEELKKGVAVVRNMHTKDQKEIKLDELVSLFVRG